MQPDQEETMTKKCPRCYSPDPRRHPAVQLGGEVQPCPDDFHRQVTAENTPERIAKVDALLERMVARA